jgi:enoyl-CoA hydratase
MPYENILTEQKNATLHITINRASKLNALNKATLSELNAAFQAAFADEEVRAIILTGDGAKAFVAGADIAEFADFSVAQGAALSSEGHAQVFNLIENSPKPVIAAINGFALGGGLELAMACHIRVASETAKMGLPEVGLGVIPGYGGTQRLAQLIGKGRAMEMIVTADVINAAEAYRMGLVNHVVAPENLITKCEEIVSKIITKSPVAISYAIKSVNAGFEEGQNGYASEIENFGACFGTKDFKEGTTAFLEKRKANFSGN